MRSTTAGYMTLGAMVLLLAGCVRPGAVEAARKSLQADALVTISGFAFMPDHVTIHQGQSVEWNNTEMMETHTITDDPALAKKSEDALLPAGAEPFNSGNLKPGQTFRHVFSVPGHYRYFCLPHEHFGMVGDIEVLPDPATRP